MSNDLQQWTQEKTRFAELSDTELLQEWLKIGDETRQDALLFEFAERFAKAKNIKLLEILPKDDVLNALAQRMQRHINHILNIDID